MKHEQARNSEIKLLPGDFISIITHVDSSDTEKVYLMWEQLTNQSIKTFEWIIVTDSNVTFNEDLKNFIGNKVFIKECNTNSDRSLNLLPLEQKNLIKGNYILLLDANLMISCFLLEKLVLTLKINPSIRSISTLMSRYHSKGETIKSPVAPMMANKCYFNEQQLEDILEYSSKSFLQCLEYSVTQSYFIPETLCYDKELSVGYQRTVNNISDFKKNGQRFAELKSYIFEPQKSESYFNYGDYSGSDRNLLLMIPWMEIGGADKFNLSLIKGLKEMGWKVTIANTLSADNQWEEKFKQVTDDIFIFPNYSTSYFYYEILDHLIRSRNIRILFISNSQYGYYILPYLIKKFPLLHIVDYVHCVENDWFNGGYAMFSCIYNSLISHTFASSLHLKNWCIQNGSNSQNISVCYINIDTENWRRRDLLRYEYRNKVNADIDTPVLLYVARITDQKQPMVLIAIINSLYKQSTKFKCIIIGDGPDRKKLERAIAVSPAKSNIIYMGGLSNEEVMNYMDASDIFLLPSLYEGIALSVYEAMAKSLAIVSVASGGQEELVTEACGYLIKPSGIDEVEQYSNCLYRLLNDPNMIQKMGKAGRERVETYFDIRLMIRQIDNILMDMQPKVNSTSENPEVSLVVLNQLFLTEYYNKTASDNLQSNPFLGMIRAYATRYPRLKKIYCWIKSNT